MYKTILLKKLGYQLLIAVLVAGSYKQGFSQCNVPSVNGNQVLCNGQPITLTAEAGYDSYAWSTGSNDASTEITSPGTYQVTVTCSNGSTAFANVSVSGFTTGVQAGGNGQVCAGQCINLTVLLTNGSNGPYEIVLELSTGGTETFSVNPTGGFPFAIISVCPDETTTYTVQSVTNANGCAAFVNPNFVSATVTVIAAGNLSIDGPTQICQGTPSQLSADPGNYQFYSWSNGGSGPTTNITQAGTYTVTATIASGCTASASITVDALPFTLPEISGGTALCTNGSVTLEVNNATYDTYNWSNGGSGQSIVVSAGGTYTVTVTDANGCTGTDIIVVGNAPPASTSIQGPTTFCTGASINLLATGNFSNYAWSNGESQASITVNQSGIYTVTVTNSQGCTGTASTSITESATPTVTFSASNADICQGACLTLNVTFTGNPPFTLAGQLVSGNDILGTFNQTYTTANGTLTVCAPGNAPAGLLQVNATSLTDANCNCQ
jgi:hypothetical protein